MQTEPIANPKFTQSPMLMSGESLHGAPGPAAIGSDGCWAFYWAVGHRLQLWVFDPTTAELQPWSSEPFAAKAGQRSLIDRFFVDRPAWSPQGTLLAGAGVGDGHKHTRIWLWTAPGQQRLLTPQTSPGDQRNPVWSPDGNWLAFVSYRDGKDDIWLQSMQDGSPVQQLTWDRFSNFDPRWSPQGDKIAFTSQRSDADPLCCQIAVMDLASGCVDVLSDGGRIHNRYPRWSPQGSKLYFLSDRSGCDEIWAVDLQTKHTEQITAATGQDKGEFTISPAGTHIAYSQADGCSHRLEVMDLATRTVRRLDSGPGVRLYPTWSGPSTVVVREETPAQGPELAAYSILSGERGSTTSCSVAYSAPDSSVSSEVWFPSFDGKQINGVLYYDQALVDAGQKLPAILYIHGGPNGQHIHGWWPFFQHLTGEGFAIFAINSRGSTGYGRSFMDLNLNDWGGGDRKDWLAAVDYLRQQPFVDGGRIGVWGRSYGGYSTIRALSAHPDVFKAGVCHFGPVDLAAFFEETTVRELMIHFFGLPRLNSEGYRRCSVVDDLQNIVSPLLILQGDADHGVPKSQSEMIYEYLKSRQRTVYYTCYPEEGHGFDRAEHIYDAAGRITSFWKSYL